MVTPSVLTICTATVSDADRFTEWVASTHVVAVTTTLQVSAVALPLTNTVTAALAVVSSCTLSFDRVPSTGIGAAAAAALGASISRRPNPTNPLASSGSMKSTPPESTGLPPLGPGSPFGPSTPLAPTAPGGPGTP